MALTKFYLFPLLPSELRRKIYMMATTHDPGPDKARPEPHTLCLSLATYDAAAPIQRQQTLESFGFSCANPRCLCCYARDTAQLAGREPASHLYSNALIPALLHTCVESRHELMNRGYRLAFRTRSSEPRTWFNFDRDILFLNYSLRGSHSLLGNSPWSVT